MKKVLIIDDEVDICYLLGSILKNKNLQTEYVNSLSEAKEILQDHQPSLVFIDNHLPDGRGVDFIGEIKKMFPSIKVVMITAYDTSADKNIAIRSGVDGFIGKPFTKDSIYKTLEEVSN